MIAALVVLGVWLILLTVWVKKITNHYNNLVQGTDAKSLHSVLESQLRKIDGLQNRTVEIERVLKQVRAEDVSHIQKWAIVKFNPFEESGGEQSFVACFLDDKGDGVVISSLHGRNTTRVFAKSVKAWNGESKLSKEEAEVIEKARKS